MLSQVAHAAGASYGKRENAKDTEVRAPPHALTLFALFACLLACLRDSVFHSVQVQWWAFAHFMHQAGSDDILAGAESQHDADWEIDPQELEIKEVVGSGEFGTVHRALWLGSTVAVKVGAVEAPLLEPSVMWHWPISLNEPLRLS